MAQTTKSPPLHEKPTTLKTKTSSSTSNNSSESPKEKKAKSNNEEKRPMVESRATKVEEPPRLDPLNIPIPPAGKLTRSRSLETDTGDEHDSTGDDSDDSNVKRVKLPESSRFIALRKDKLRRLEAQKLRHAASEKELQERLAVERAEAGRLATVAWLEKQQVNKYKRR